MSLDLPVTWLAIELREYVILFCENSFSESVGRRAEILFSLVFLVRSGWLMFEHYKLLTGLSKRLMST